RRVYRAGQILRWRVTALRSVDAHPVAGAVEVSIRDPRGTAIWSGRERVDGTGMIAGEVPLGEDLVLGGYTLRASLGSASATERIEVRDYRLAPFQVTIEPASAPPLAGGAELRGAVVARYPYGEPVRGELELTAHAGHKQVIDLRGQLDD